jgi:hypothetical protein
VHRRLAAPPVGSSRASERDITQASAALSAIKIEQSSRWSQRSHLCRGLFPRYSDQRQPKKGAPQVFDWHWHPVMQGAPKGNLGAHLPIAQWYPLEHLIGSQMLSQPT